ncbi:hypothetical protein DFH08DRAFT_986348 [Mycena albidolilacea]|uniref:Uncharacterized protein n=1 Tax=Mycena albidolilacea TaxID=1033008 RepID=A0AAD6Z297_9AGAR|nr:hypothetical protein DFH08DRAFT_986348 [Mycena albidolilacea]
MFPQFTRFTPCSPSKICKMASDLCVASKFCLNISHSSSSASRQLLPRFSTSHTLDFGLRIDRTAAECLVFFPQFLETLCLSSVPNEAPNGAILVHRWSVAFCPPRDQAHRPLKPNHPRDFAALGDAQTSSRCSKHSEDISLHSIQGATTTIWWLPPQRLPISVFNATMNSAPSATGSPSFDCGAVPHLPFKINYPAHDCAIQHLQIPFHFLGFRRLRGQLNPASPCIPDALLFLSQPVKAAREQGKLTPLVHLGGLCCVLASNFGNDVLWPPPPGFERQYKMSYSSQ